MTNFYNCEPGNPRSYMDIDTGDITVVTDNGCGYHSVFRIKNKK